MQPFFFGHQSSIYFDFDWLHCFCVKCPCMHCILCTRNSGLFQGLLISNQPRLLGWISKRWLPATAVRAMGLTKKHVCILLSLGVWEWTWELGGFWGAQFLARQESDRLSVLNENGCWNAKENANQRRIWFWHKETYGLAHWKLLGWFEISFTPSCFFCWWLLIFLFLDSNPPNCLFD